MTFTLTVCEEDPTRKAPLETPQTGAVLQTQQIVALLQRKCAPCSDEPPAPPHEMKTLADSHPKEASEDQEAVLQETLLPPPQQPPTILPPQQQQREDEQEEQPTATSRLLRSPTAEESKRIYVAVYYNYFDLIRRLYEEQHLNVFEARDLIFGCGPLQVAARRGHHDVVVYLLSNGGQVDDMDLFGSTALHAAASMGRPEICIYLLSHGASIDLEDVFGCTPLHDAAWKGNFAVCRLLVDHGANVMAMNNDQRTPLEEAVRGKKNDETRVDRKRRKSTREYLREQRLRRSDHPVEDAA